MLSVSSCFGNGQAHLQVCALMGCQARKVLEAMSRSFHIGLACTGLNCMLDSGIPANGHAASSCLDIAQYLSQSQCTYNFGDSDAHTWNADTGLVRQHTRLAGIPPKHLLTLLQLLVICTWTYNFQVANPRGGKLVLTGYTLEHITWHLQGCSSHCGR